MLLVFGSHDCGNGYLTDPSRHNSFVCHARGLVEISLVHFILQSTYDWSIDYLRGRFGV
jgi:hypothetical protein